MVFLLRAFFCYHEIVIAIPDRDCQAFQSPEIAPRFQRLVDEFKRFLVEDTQINNLAFNTAGQWIRPSKRAALTSAADTRRLWATSTEWIAPSISFAQKSRKR